MAEECKEKTGKDLLGKEFFPGMWSGEVLLWFEGERDNECSEWKKGTKLKLEQLASEGKGSPLITFKRSSPAVIKKEIKSPNGGGKKRENKYFEEEQG